MDRDGFAPGMPVAERERAPMPPRVIDPRQFTAAVTSLAQAHEWIEKLIAEVHLPTHPDRVTDGAREFVRRSRGRLGL